MKHKSFALICSALFAIAVVICRDNHATLRHALEIACFMCFMEGSF